jgi:hypothetical protein
MSIGEFLSDMFQSHWFTDIRIDGIPITWTPVNAYGDLWNIAMNVGNTNFSIQSIISDNINGNPRIGPETRGASISSYLCIKF